MGKIDRSEAAQVSGKQRENYLSGKERVLISALLQNFKPDISVSFFEAPDFTNDKSIMFAVTVLAHRWNEFCELEISYEKGRVFYKNSKLKATLEIWSAVTIWMHLPSHKCIWKVLNLSFVKKHNLIVAQNNKWAETNYWQRLSTQRVGITCIYYVSEIWRKALYTLCRT